MIIRPPMIGETPLSPSEAAYLIHDYELPSARTNCISSQIRFNDHSYGKAGFSLCHLANEQMGKGSARAFMFAGAGACGTGAEKSE